MNYKTLRETLQDITEATASMQAKAAAKKLMIKLYGKGTVTFESHSGGHFVEHESEGGDAHAHTFNPVTGKISKTPHVTSSYYGESVTNRQDITEASELKAEFVKNIKIEGEIGELYNVGLDYYVVKWYRDNTEKEPSGQYKNNTMYTEVWRSDKNGKVDVRNGTEYERQRWHSGKSIMAQFLKFRSKKDITEAKNEDFVFSIKQAKAAAKQLGAKLIATTVGEDGYEGFEYHLLQKGNLFSIVSYAYGDYSGLDGDPGPNTVKDFIAQTKMGNHSGEGQFQSKQALLSSFSQIFDDHDKQAEAFMRSKLK